MLVLAFGVAILYEHARLASLETDASLLPTLGTADNLVHPTTMTSTRGEQVRWQISIWRDVTPFP
jgi:hypothetical protein